MRSHPLTLTSCHDLGGKAPQFARIGLIAQKREQLRQIDWERGGGDSQSGRASETYELQLSVLSAKLRREPDGGEGL